MRPAIEYAMSCKHEKSAGQPSRKPERSRRPEKSEETHDGVGEKERPLEPVPDQLVLLLAVLVVRVVFLRQSVLVLRKKVKENKKGLSVFRCLRATRMTA